MRIVCGGRTRRSVASLKHHIRPHGGLDRRVLAVLLHENVGAVEDVDTDTDVPCDENAREPKPPDALADFLS